MKRLHVQIYIFDFFFLKKKERGGYPRVAIAFVSRFSLYLNWGRLEGARDTEALSIINPKNKENDHQFMKTRGFPYNVIKGPFLHVSLMYTVISTRVNFTYFVVYSYFGSISSPTT